MIKNRQIIFPKVVYRTPPENAFMNVYFYFYSVVKCGNRALGINEQIKKSSRTQKRTQTHHCREVIEGPPGGPYRKYFEREPPRANDSPLKHQCFMKSDWCNWKVIIIVESIVTWNTYMENKRMISSQVRGRRQLSFVWGTQ
jgi:hypothetical protein